MHRFEEIGGSYLREGVAKNRGLKNRCQMKLWILSSDKELIFDVMYEASQASDCYQVMIQKNHRKNVFCGSCTFTNESSVGDAWARYTSHPELWVFVQDEEFCNSFKDRIRTY